MRILIADDHPIVREGWVALLAREKDYQVVAECSNGQEAVRAWSELHPDVGLVDLRMPVLDGLGAIAQIVDLDPAAKLVVLTTFAEEENIARALNAGARGYLLKDATPARLLECLATVSRGGRYVSADLLARLEDCRGAEKLTRREREVLQGLERGLTNKEIADELQVGSETVKGYLKSLLAKLGASRRTQAVHIARQRGYL